MIGDEPIVVRDPEILRMLAERESQAARLETSNIELRRRDRLLQAVAEITKVLLSVPDCHAAMPQVLRALGEAAEIHRVVLLIERPISDTDPELAHHVACEWSAPGIQTHAELGLTVLPNAATPSFVTPLHAGQSVWSRIEDFHDSLRSAFLRLSVCSTGCVPIFVSGRYLGALTFDDCVSSRDWSEAEISTLTAGANAVATALERFNLEAAQQAAAIERSESLASLNRELQRRNRLLDAAARSSALLSAREDFDAAVSEALGIVGEAAEFDRVAVIEHLDADGNPGTEFWQISQEWRRAGVAIPAEHPLPRGRMDAAPVFSAAMLVRDNVVQRRTEELQDEVMRRYQQAKGARLLVAGNIWINGFAWGGFVGDDYRTDRLRSDEENNVLIAATRAIGQAIYRRRMERHAEALQRQILAERQHTVQTRVDELARANKALRESLSRMADEERLDALLDHVLMEAARQADAVSNALFLYDAATNSLSMKRFFYHGEFLDIATDSRLEMWRTPVPADVSTAWDELARLRTIVQAVPTDDPRIWAFALPWHEQMGHRYIVCIPLYAGTRAFGFMAPCFDTVAAFDLHTRELLEALAQQASLALKANELAEQAKQAALAQQQRLAAEEQAEQLERSSAALQRTIDAIGRLESMDAFIPEMLRIAAAAFDVTDGAYFEVDEDETVTPRYWLRRGQVYRAVALPLADERHRETFNWLIEGFRSPVDYLGSTSVSRKRTVILDHRGEIGLPKVHAFARSMGWLSEMNIPVVIGDVACAALVVYRGDESAFQEADRLLSESLSKQIAFAIQASRIAEREREAAVTRQQAVELARANEALRRSAESLVGAPDLAAYLAAFLREATTLNSAKSAGVFSYDEATERFQMIAFITGGRIVTIASEPGMEFWREPVPLFITRPWVRQLRENNYASFDNRVPLPDHPWPISRDWHTAMGHRFVVTVPLHAGGHLVGSLGQCFTTDVFPASFNYEQTRVLAQQAALAIQMSHLSEEASKAAVASEQVNAASQRVVELSLANASMKRALDLLATDPDLDHSLGHMLQVISEHIDAPMSALWLYDAAQERFNVSLIYHQGEILRAGDDHPGARLWPVGRGLVLYEHMRQRRPIVYSLDTEDDNMPAMREFYRQIGVQTLLGVPLILGSEIIGTLTVRFMRHRDFTPEQLELIQALAHQATLAIQFTRLARHAQEQSRAAATLEERARIARDIHDTLAQGLAGIILQLQAAQRERRGSERALRIERALDAARSHLVDARRSVSALRSPSQDRGDLPKALDAVLKSVFASSQIDTHVEVIGQRRSLPESHESELIRIVQEAAINTLKHARASRFDVQLEFSPRGLEMRLYDNGRGFSPKRSYEGFGLIGMRERAERIGGVLGITSAPGTATQIVVRVPDPPANDSAGPPNPDRRGLPAGDTE